MAWKDLFHFSTGERIGIFVLLGIILLSVLGPVGYRWALPPKSIDFSEFEAAVDEFEAKLEERRFAREADRESRRAWQNQNRNQRFFRNEPIKLKPFRFNPNNLPLSEWQKMGMPDNIAIRIHNYERAGGNFRFKEDLARIYSITEDIYNQLEPYIDLPSRSSQSHDRTKTAGVRPEFERPPLINERNIVNLNTADSATLVTVRGIGPAFSRRIINYRNKLGGYVNKGQLMEVFGMDSARFELIQNWLEIDPTAITQINVNTSNWENLVRHPYINGNIANSIIALRNQHGPFKKAEDVKKSKLITDSIFRKIAPYLSVD